VLGGADLHVLGEFCKRAVTLVAKLVGALTARLGRDDILVQTRDLVQQHVGVLRLPAQALIALALQRGDASEHRPDPARQLCRSREQVGADGEVLGAVGEALGVRPEGVERSLDRRSLDRKQVLHSIEEVPAQARRGRTRSLLQELRLEEPIDRRLDGHGPDPVPERAILRCELGGLTAVSRGLRVRDVLPGGGDRALMREQGRTTDGERREDGQGRSYALQLAPPPSGSEEVSAAPLS